MDSSAFLLFLSWQMEVGMGPGAPSTSPPAVSMVNDDERPSLAVAGIGKQEMGKNQVWKGYLSLTAWLAVDIVVGSGKTGLLFPHFQTYSFFLVWGTSLNSTCSMSGGSSAAGLPGWSFCTTNKDLDFIKFPPSGNNPGTVPMAGEWINQADSHRSKTILWHSLCF